MTTQNSRAGNQLDAKEELTSFVEEVCGDANIRIEEDFGSGFVRLKSSEAEKRQAIQDIRSNEDVVLELLRNSRDAGAHHIFVATQKDAAHRSIVMIDDGCGVPEYLHDRIFEPRVTSKLDSCHVDKWGMHGRGMALYSISVNADSALVQKSAEEAGTAISIRTNIKNLSEKTDQSTFPHFDKVDAVLSMRGPKNILRTIAEFSLEHKGELSVYCGSPTDIAATIYQFGMSTTTPSIRAFYENRDKQKLTQRLAFGATPELFADIAQDLGLDISTRSARRILNGEIKPLPSILERIYSESFPREKTKTKNPHTKSRAAKKSPPVKIAAEDLALFTSEIQSVFTDIASRYFLEDAIDPEIRISDNVIHIDIPLKKLH